MPDHFTVSTVLPAPPKRLFDAWLDSREHSAFTGDTAVIDPKVDGGFNAFSGYITGTTLEIQAPRRIVQTWRTTEFPEGTPDSRLEVVFEAVTGGTRFTLRHSQIPTGQGPQYEDGWKEHYFQPMAEYFRTR